MRQSLRVLPMDNSKVCYFRYETAEFTILYPNAFENLPLAKMRKIFKFMCSDPYGNVDAICITQEALRSYVQETRSAWEKASKEFVDGYVDVQHKLVFKKRQVMANNKKLRSAVAKAKFNHERAKALLTYFESL